MPTGHDRGSAAVGVRGTKIYLAGGMRTLTPGPGGLRDTVSTVSSYDVVTRRWRYLPSLPEARDHVGGAVVDGTFYVLGGEGNPDPNSSSVFPEVEAYAYRPSHPPVPHRKPRS